MADADAVADRRVAVLGHFAFETQRVDGQIHRTRVVLNELRERLGPDRVHAVDTGHLASRPLSTLASVWKAASKASDVVIMPGVRGLRWLFPIYRWHNRRNGLKIHYFVVGGWLPRQARQGPALVNRLRHCEGVYVQTRRMLGELRQLGLDNVSLMPNFRSFPIDRSTSSGVGMPFRLVFLSRVLPDKGPDVAARVVDRINAERSDAAVKVILDIFGPIQPGHEDWFTGVMQRAGGAVRYLGVLAPEKIPETLAGYDAMVFPTRYSGEGFPGVVLDAMISGIPVVASNWQDNGEIVEDGVTGLLFETGDEQALESRIRWLIDHPAQVEAMKRESARRAVDFHVDRIFPPVLERMNLTRRADGVRAGLAAPAHRPSNRHG